MTRVSKRAGMNSVEDRVGMDMRSAFRARVGRRRGIPLEDGLEGVTVGCVLDLGGEVGEDLDTPRALKWSWMVKRQAVNVMGRIWLSAMNGIMVLVERACCCAGRYQLCISAFHRSHPHTRCPKQNHKKKREERKTTHLSPPSKHSTPTSPTPPHASKPHSPSSPPTPSQNPQTTYSPASTSPDSTPPPSPLANS